MFNLIRFPSISRNPRISLHSPNFITLSHPTFSNKMHFIVTNSLSLSLNLVSGPNFSPMVSKRQTNKRGGKNNACKSWGARGRKRKKGREGRREGRHGSIANKIRNRRGKWSNEELRAGSCGKGCELLHARRRRTIASSGARILYTRGTCARHACELYLRYICKYVRQCVSVEC